MFGQSARDRERLDRLEQTVDVIAALVQRIEAALVVRDPGTARSVEAYDGLRKQVVAASGERRRMCVQLVEIHDRIAAGASATDMKSLVEEWLVQAGLVRLDDPTPLEAFEILGGQGEDLRVLKAAWVDAQTGAILRLGALERVPASPDLPAPASTSPPRDENTAAEGESPQETLGEGPATGSTGVTASTSEGDGSEPPTVPPDAPSDAAQHVADPAPTDQERAS